MANYQINNLPYDLPEQLNSCSDPDLKTIFDDSKQRTLYFYPIHSLYKDNDITEIKFAPNIVTIGFLDVSEGIQVTAYEINNFKGQLKANTININNGDDNIIQYKNLDQRQLLSQELDLLYQFKLYAISINEPVTENNLNNLYILNDYEQPYQGKTTISTKTITMTKISDFTPNNGNPLIIKLQKSLATDEKVQNIDIKFPKTMMFGNVRVTGEIDGVKVSPNLIIDDNNQLFPLYTLPIETEPKVNILQQWFSDQVLKWEEAKKFTEANLITDILDIGAITPNPTSEPFKHVKAIELKQVKTLTHDITYSKDIEKNIDNILISKDDFSSFLTLSGGSRPYFVTEQKNQYNQITWKLLSVDSVALTYEEYKPLTSLGQLLINMLNYTYNYQRNFDGISLQTDPDSMNEIDKLRIKFEGQKPQEVISNLFEQWKLDNPEFISNETVKTFKQVVMMLSHYIISNLSINQGLDDDNKILLPYYFELISKPTRRSEKEIWKYENVKVILKSNYFDFSNLNNIKVLNNNLSQNIWFRLDDNQFSWIELNQQIEVNNIPSLLPKDMSLNNGEFGKYQIKAITNNVGNLLELFNSEKQYFSFWDWFIFTQSNLVSSSISLKLEKAISKLNRLEISGIFGAGNYSFSIKTTKGIININNINLFNINNQMLSYITLDL